MPNRLKGRVESKGRECAKCSTFKEWEEFPNGSGPYGKSPYCRECWRIIRGNKKRAKRIEADGRECCKCGKFLPWDDYNKNASGPHGRHCVCRI
jgi:hypothetical protein